MADESYIGVGKITLNGIEVGNCSALELSITEDKKDQKDYQTPGGGLANSVTRISSVGISMTVLEFKAENLALALFGSTSAVAAGAIANETQAAPAVLDADTLILLDNVVDTTVAPAVTDGAATTYVEGDDYIVSAAGITVLAAGSIPAGGTLDVSYTRKAVDVIQSLVNSAAEYKLVFDGLNEAQSGAPVVVIIHRAKFGPTQGLPLIGDDFSSMEFTGDALKDASITGAGLSKYVEVRAA